MPKTVNGYVMNIPGDPQPWGTREMNIIEVILGFLPPNGDLLVDTHHHYALYSDDEGTADPEIYVDDNGGDPLVGVGTQNPKGNLHVMVSDTGQTPAVTGDQLVVERNDTCGISILTPNNRFGYLIFGDTDNDDQGFIAYDHANDRMIFQVDAGDQCVIDTDGNFGVGLNTGLLAKCHIYSGDSGATPAGVADDIFVENSTDCGITIGCPSTNDGFVFFADEGGAQAGYIQYNHPSDEMTFGTSATAHMTIDSGGRVGIRSPNPQSGLHIDDDAGGADMGYITIEELSAAAAAPAVNRCALYCIDNAGKTELYARFATGASQLIAAQP